MTSRDSREPEALEIIRSEIRSALLATHVAKPGRVVSFDSETQTATVEPLFLQVFRTELDEEDTQPMPPIAGAPVCWPSFGGWELVGTLEPGDLVTLLFADRALDAWEGAPSKASDPASARLHALSDAFVIPNLSSGRTDVPVEPATSRPAFLRHRSGSPAIELRADGTIALHAGGDADQHAVRGDELVAYLQSLFAWAGTHTHAPGSPAAPPPPQVPTTLVSLLALLR